MTGEQHDSYKRISSIFDFHSSVSVDFFLLYSDVQLATATREEKGVGGKNLPREHGH
jgi:hypothetical protein